MSYDSSFESETLHAYVDGELSAADAARFENALASDPALAARLEELLALDQAIATLPGLDDTSPDFTDRVLQRAHAPRGGRLLRLLVPFAAAAAILLAVVFVLRSDKTEPTDIFDEADYVDYRWEVDTDTFGSLAVTDLESEILSDLRAT